MHAETLVLASSQAAKVTSVNTARHDLGHVLRASECRGSALCLQARFLILNDRTCPASVVQLTVSYSALV